MRLVHLWGQFPVALRSIFSAPPESDPRIKGGPPPWLTKIATEIFSKFHSGKNRKRPPAYGTQAKKFISKMWPGGEAFRGRFKHFTGTPLGCPVAGRAGSVSGPQYRRFIFPEEGLRVLFGMLVPPVGEVGQ